MPQRTSTDRLKAHRKKYKQIQDKLKLERIAKLKIT